MAGNRPGPGRSPTALKELHGTARPDRAPRREPRPRSTRPTRPANLSPAARALWDRLIRDYGHTGVLTAIDRETLRAYVEACVRYEVAAVRLEAEGPLARGDRGQPIKNPLHQIVRDDALLALRLARELGFTPSARASLEAPDDSDELDAWARTG